LGSERSPHPNGLAYVPVGIPLVLWGIALSVVSIGGTGDTPCGSLLEPSFRDALSPSTLCGTVHLGQLVVVSGLVGGGCMVVGGGILAWRGRAPLWLPALVLAGMTTTALVGWLALQKESGRWASDFDVRRWTPVRNLAGFAAAASAFALLFGLAVAFSEPRQASRRLDA
jgi:hypothetical protein